MGEASIGTVSSMIGRLRPTVFVIGVGLILLGVVALYLDHKEAVVGVITALAAIAKDIVQSDEKGVGQEGKPETETT